MGLHQKLSEWIRITKDTFDFGPEFPTAMAARRLEFAEELAKLRYQLEQAQKASQKKDELIARLRAAGTVEGNMVVDGSAYFIRKENLLDGPFCTACFQQSHKTSRIVPAPRPTGVDGDSSDWVQCAKCRTPFRSERISEYLNPRPTAPAQPEASPEEHEGAKPVPMARKPRTPNRRKKEPLAQGTKAIGRPRADLSQ